MHPRALRGLGLRHPSPGDPLEPVLGRLRLCSEETLVLPAPAPHPQSAADDTEAKRHKSRKPPRTHGWQRNGPRPQLAWLRASQVPKRDKGPS